MFTDGTIPITIPKEKLIGSYIDIKIFRRSTKDEVVVAKAIIIAADGNKLLFYLNDKESNDLADAAAEGSLRIEGYIAPDQKAREVTYVPNTNESITSIQP
jgi:hypothetical protein